MASTVTYTGPKDEASRTVNYQIDDGDKDITFRINVPVTGVSAKVAKRLRDDDAHTFEITDDDKSTTTGQGA